MKQIGILAMLLAACMALAACTTTPSAETSEGSSQTEGMAPVSTPEEGVPAPSGAPEESEGKASALTLSVKETAITPDTEPITIVIENNTDEEYTYGEEYSLERQTDGGWTKLEYLPNTAWNDIGIIVPARGKSEHQIRPANFYGEDALTPGYYRYVSKFNGETYDVGFYIEAAKDGASSAPESSRPAVSGEVAAKMQGIENPKGNS